MKKVLLIVLLMVSLVGCGLNTKYVNVVETDPSESYGIVTTSHSDCFINGVNGNSFYPSGFVGFFKKLFFDYSERQIALKPNKYTVRVMHKEVNYTAAYATLTVTVKAGHKYLIDSQNNYGGTVRFTVMDDTKKASE